MSLPKGRSPPASQVRPGLPQQSLPRGPSPQTRDDRIYSTSVAQYAVSRQQGPPQASYGAAHDMSKAAQPLAPTQQPPHAPSPGLQQHPYTASQAGPPSLVFQAAPPTQQPPPMNTQAPQTRQFMQPRPVSQNSGPRVAGSQPNMRSMAPAPAPGMYQPGTQQAAPTMINPLSYSMQYSQATGTGPQYYFTTQNQFRPPYVNQTPQYPVQPAGTASALFSGPGHGTEYPYGNTFYSGAAAQAVPPYSLQQPPFVPISHAQQQQQQQQQQHSFLMGGGAFPWFEQSLFGGATSFTPFPRDLTASDVPSAAAHFFPVREASTGSRPASEIPALDGLSLADHRAVKEPPPPPL